MEQRMTALQQKVGVQDGMIVDLKARLEVFEKLQEDYWVCQAALDGKVEDATLRAADFGRELREEVRSLGDKCSWDNNMIHKLRGEAPSPDYQGRWSLLLQGEGWRQA